jgi:hypothetical protein
VLAGAPVADPLLEGAGLPLDEAGGAVEEPALEPHAEVGVDELALDELEEVEPLEAVMLLAAVLLPLVLLPLLLALLLVPLVPLVLPPLVLLVLVAEPEAPPVPEVLAGVQEPAAGALAGAVSMDTTGSPPEASGGFRVW